jgi:hypothetical protein
MVALAHDIPPDPLLVFRDRFALVPIDGISTQHCHLLPICVLAHSF